MIAVAGDEHVAVERAELRRTLDELVAGASMHRDRAQRDRMVDLAGRLAVPAAAFLRPELECRLADYVEEDDSFARDQVARILALACGISALPALLRALIRDRNDDGDTLQLDVLVLMEGSPGEALGQARSCVASHDPLVRRSAVGGLSSWPEEAVTEALAGCVNDPDRWVRHQVAWSLSRRPGATARAALDRLAADPDVDVSSAARRVPALPVRLV